MLHHTKNWMLISALTVSLAACGGNSETATNPTGTPDTSASTTVQPVAQTTDAAANASASSVVDLNAVKFQPPTGKTLYGFFDAVNNSNATSHKTTKKAPLVVGGWAVLANKGQVADRVLITLPDKKTLVAVVPVNQARPDVVKAFNNPAYQNSGWSATINPATLPAGKVVLQAWSYNSATQEAFPINPTHEIVIGE